MALKTLTTLLFGFFFVLGRSTAIEGDGTCKKGGACDDDMSTQGDISVLFQSKSAQVLAALVQQTNGPNMAADQIEESTRPRVQKLMEIKAAVHDIKDLIGAGSTPEVEELIQQMIAIIDADLQVKIKRDQTNAQTELDTRIIKLTNTTKIAVSAKAEVDKLDLAHDQCVTHEQQLLEAYEACKAEEAKLMEEVGSATVAQITLMEEVSLMEEPSDAYCGHPDLNISYSNPPQLPATLTVDFSKGLTHVEQELDQYLVPLKKWIDDLINDEAPNDQKRWDAAHKRCEAKKTELADKKKECGQVLDAWIILHEKCLNVKNGQKLSLCEFGQAYQTKCAAKTAFDTLKAAIDGRGTVWSEPDRENEWTETVKLTCVLAKFKTTTNLSTVAVDNCTKPPAVTAADFGRDVTRIDTKQATYDALTSNESFTCAETHVTFGSGAFWTVPINAARVAGWIPSSASYTRATSHAYAVDPDSSQPPFDDCHPGGIPDETVEAIISSASAIFTAADTNGDKEVDRAEGDAVLHHDMVKAWLSHLELEAHETEAFFPLLDADGDERITYNEFVKGILRLAVEALFLSTDTDRDGKVSQEEFVVRLLDETFKQQIEPLLKIPDLTPQETDGIFKMLSGGDGSITLDELVVLFEARLVDHASN